MGTDIVLGMEGDQLAGMFAAMDGAAMSEVMAPEFMLEAAGKDVI
ncbi:MAG: hypothetical protein CM1200mP22_16250 [Dehalococcoidia bacterium]|nr:MAG: hypothetical protein CM1200mP22_16250 [Dehalococcoidia bacterium]